MSRKHLDELEAQLAAETTILDLDLDERTAGFVPDGFERRVRAQERAAREAQASEQRWAAAQQLDSGRDGQALELAGPGLRGDIEAARKLYGELGQQLDRGGLARSERRVLVGARRLLEETWGVNLVRPEMRIGERKRFTVDVPLVRGGEHSTVPVTQVQAVAAFQRSYTPRGRGRAGMRMQLQGVYYGVEAQGRADVVYADTLAREHEALLRQQAGLRKRGAEVPDRLKTRIALIEKEQAALVAAREHTAAQLRARFPKKT